MKTTVPVMHQDGETLRPCALSRLLGTLLPSLGLFAILGALPAEGQEERLPECAIRSLLGHRDAVKSVAWFPDGKSVVSGSRDTLLALWDPMAGRQIRVFEGHDGGIGSVAVSPDGKKLLSGSQDRTLGVWETSTGKLLKRLKGHTGWVSWVAFGPEGRRAFSGGLDRAISVWSLEEGKRTRTFIADTLRLHSVAFSRDGLFALTGNEGKEVWLWKLDTGMRRPKPLKTHLWWTRALALSPDNSLALASNGDRTLDLIDVKTGDALRVLKGQDGWAWSIKFSPDGSWAAAGGQDGSVAIWDVASGKLLARYPAAGGQVWSVDFSPGGRFLASGHEDGRILIWHPGQEVLQEGADWLRTWRRKEDKEKNRDLENLLTQLTSSRWKRVTLATEKLILAGERSIQTILEEQFPGLGAATPTKEALKKIRSDLDADDFDVRAGARRRLLSYGRAALPWIEKTLKKEPELTPEVKAALRSVMKRFTDADPWKPTKARVRALLVLLEMPRSKKVLEALGVYADGPRKNPLVELARRALAR